MVCGSRPDGSDGRIGELAPATLRAAMFCVGQEIDAAGSDIAAIAARLAHDINVALDSVTLDQVCEGGEAHE